jgi:hypothetical protein
MNVEIGTEATQFPEKIYINVGFSMQCCTVLVRESLEVYHSGQQFFGMDAHSSTIFVGRTIILQKPIFLGG